MAFLRAADLQRRLRVDALCPGNRFEQIGAQRGTLQRAYRFGDFVGMNGQGRGLNDARLDSRRRERRFSAQDVGFRQPFDRRPPVFARQRQVQLVAAQRAAPLEQRDDCFFDRIDHQFRRVMLAQADEQIAVSGQAGRQPDPQAEANRRAVGLAHPHGKRDLFVRHHRAWIETR